MISRGIVFSLILFFVFPICMSAQLSRDVIESLATNHVDRWSLYLNLTTYRKERLKEVWIDHEQKKSEILRNSDDIKGCLLYTSPSPRDATLSRMPSSA